MSQNELMQSLLSWFAALASNVCAHGALGTAAQVVQLVIAGGLIRNPEALAAPTSHASFRQQNAVLAPVRLTC